MVEYFRFLVIWVVFGAVLVFGLLLVSNKNDGREGIHENRGKRSIATPQDIEIKHDQLNLKPTHYYVIIDLEEINLMRDIEDEMYRGTVQISFDAGTIPDHIYLKCIDQTLIYGDIYVEYYDRNSQKQLKIPLVRMEPITYTNVLVHKLIINDENNRKIYPNIEKFTLVVNYQTRFPELHSFNYVDGEDDVDHYVVAGFHFDSTYSICPFFGEGEIHMESNDTFPSIYVTIRRPNEHWNLIIDGEVTSMFMYPASIHGQVYNDFNIRNLSFIVTNFARSNKSCIYHRIAIADDETIKSFVENRHKYLEFYRSEFNLNVSWDPWSFACTLVLPAQVVLHHKPTYLAVYTEADLVIPRSIEPHQLYPEDYAEIAERIGISYFWGRYKHQPKYYKWLSAAIVSWYKTIVLMEAHVPVSVEYEEIMMVDEIQRALWEDSLYPVTALRDMTGYPDKVSMTKGGAIFRMMESSLSTGKFRSTIILALRTRRYFNPFTLQHVGLEPKLETLAKTYETSIGYPVIIISPQMGFLMFSQEQFCIGECSRIARTPDQKEFWLVPLNVSVGSYFPTWWLDQQLDLWKQEPSVDFYINLNSYYGFYRIQYSDEIWEEIINRFNEDPLSIRVRDRARIIDDAMNLAFAGYTGYKNVFNLLHYLDKETHYLPWLTVHRNIKIIYRLLEIWPPYVHGLTNFMITKIEPAMKIVASTEMHEKLKAIGLYWINLADFEDSRQHTVEHFMSYKEPFYEIKREIRDTECCNAVRYGPTSLFDSLKHNMSQVRADERVGKGVDAKRRFYIHCLTCTTNEALLESLIDGAAHTNFFRMNEVRLVMKLILENGGKNAAKLVMKEAKYLLETLSEVRSFATTKYTAELEAGMADLEKLIWGFDIHKAYYAMKREMIRQEVLQGHRIYDKMLEIINVVKEEFGKYIWDKESAEKYENYLKLAVDRRLMDRDDIPILMRIPDIYVKWQEEQFIREENYLPKLFEQLEHAPIDLKK